MRAEPYPFPFCRPAPPPPDEWLRELEPSFAAGRFSNQGPAVVRLEEELTTRWAPEGRVAVTTASGTAALAAALLALEARGPVAMPSFTFAATASAVELAGCTPVLCDADATTWELDPGDAAAAVERHGCAAIVHVRAFGLCRSLDAIEDVAAAAGVPLVVDSAAAFAGRLPEGGLIGGAGDAEVVSFHATKAFCVGEGGAVLAGPDLAARVRAVANFGFDRERSPVLRGLNAKMSEPTAALGCALAPRFDAQLAARREAAAALGAAARAGGGTLAPHPGDPPWQGLPVLLEDRRRRDAALAALERAGVEARPYYTPALHEAPAYRGCADRELPVTSDLAQRIVVVPVYSDFTEDELATLCAAVEQALAA